MTSLLKSKAESVTFDGVTKVYGSTVTAVNNVSLSVDSGELVTLLGPSGCGKTTMLRMIAGLEMATAGKILIGDTDVTRLPATDRDVSMVFQSYALFPHMTVMENVSYGLRVAGMVKNEIRDRAMTGLELVGLSEFGSRLPSELSGGQQQRVAVARALVLEPQVLLFDEPLSNLDAKLRRQVRDEIRELQTNLSLTVVYVTHDQEEALAVSDRIVDMRNAEIAQVGTPRELYEEPADAFVADFIGESNIVDITIMDVDAVSGQATVSLGDGSLLLHSIGLQPGAAKLALRPNHIVLGQTPDSMSTALTGEIRKCTYAGNHMEYIVSSHLGDWFVTSPNVRDLHEPGTTVDLSLRSPGPVLIQG